MTATYTLTLGEEELNLLLTPLWDRIVVLEDDVMEPDPEVGPSTPEEWREAKEELADHRALLDRVIAAQGLTLPNWPLRDKARLAVVEDDQEDHLRDCRVPGSHPLCELYDC